MNKGKKQPISPFSATMAIIFLILGVIFIIGSTHKSSNTGLKTNSTTTSQETTSSVETETKKEVIKFGTTTVEDPNLEYGKTEIRTAGVNGEITYTYEVTYEEGKETSRRQTDQKVTKQPINQVIAKGTKIVWHCIDVTSYNKNPYDDNKCTSSTGEVRYVSDSEARALDPSYSPGQSGHPYYNSK